MSGSHNEATLIGNLVADPECRRTQDGRPVVNIRLATSESWRDKATGERKERAEFHRVVIFNEGLCRVAEQYLKKGMKVLLRGQIQTRKWTDQSGTEKYSTEVVLNGYGGVLTMLDKPASRDDSDEPRRENSYASATGRPQATSRGRSTGDVLDDGGIPF